MHSSSTKRFWPLLCLALLFLVMSPDLAFAQAATPDGTCTTDPQFIIPDVPAGQGLLSTIVTDIQDTLSGISQAMFQTIAGDGGFQQIARAVLTLYIAVYGILFTFGMVQLTLFDFGVRMIKVGIIVTLLSPGAWGFFNNNVVTFFNDGTDEIIAEVTSISVGGISVPYDPQSGNAYPFAALDGVIAKAVSAKMWITLLAIVFTGPYGVIFALLLGFALRALIAALLTAMWVYLMSLVIKTLLFGLAPIFLVCILFNRTRHIFDGWLNQVVNACLQPILLFVFFAFFIKLMEGSIDNIITYDSPSNPPPVCWTEAADSVRGTPFEKHYWRFNIRNSAGEYEQYGGLWSWTGPEVDSNGQTLPVFPLDLLNILIFLMLAELATRFNSVVIQIAKDLAGASTDLMSMQGSLSQWFSPAGGRQGSLTQSLSGIGSRGVPGSSSEAQRSINDIQNKGAVQKLTDQLSNMSNQR
jgi:type IV secretory pathway VirB6-like protein